MKFILLSVGLISFGACNFSKLWQIEIDSPKNNFVLTTDANIVTSVKGHLFIDLTGSKKEKALEELAGLGGTIDCNGVKASLDKFTWEAKEVPVKPFEPNNLVCRFKTSKNSVSTSITIVSKAQEVADPGDEGLKTLEGIDSDKDGVRDDVQVWINKNFTDTDQKNALKIYSIIAQKALVEHTDKDKSISNAKLKLKSLSCNNAMFGTEFERKNRHEIEAMMLNTKERLLAESKVNEHFSGQSVLLENDPSCEIDLSLIKGGK